MKGRSGGGFGGFPVPGGRLKEPQEGEEAEDQEGPGRSEGLPYGGPHPGAPSSRHPHGVVVLGRRP
jgi:hypothetical protein